MKTKKKFSIFLNTQIYLIGFCAIVLSLLWLFETTFFRVYYSVYQTDHANKIASNITKEGILNLEKQAYENNMCIAVYYDYGEIKEYNQKMLGCRLHDTTVQKEMMTFLNSSDFHKVQTITSKSGTDLLISIRTASADVFLFTPLQDPDRVSKILHGQLIYIIIVAIILCSAFAFFLTYVITKPIRIITKKAQNIGKENYDNQFEETGILEIDELSTTLDNVQKELGKIQTYQHDLLANVGHDLKTPLTMIRAYAEKIKDISFQDRNKMNKDLDVIIDEADRLTLLVNDILNYSKLESKNDVLNIEEYDLIPEIKNIINKYEIIKETENYKIITALPKEAIIKADKLKMNQVIYNLINNAINYTGDDKTVYVELITENNKVVFKVRDTGKGIKKSEQKNIWTKYYKNDKNHKRNVVSSGLGLSIVKNILEMHGFNYGVDSVLGKGSTFYFKINSSSKHKNITKES